MHLQILNTDQINLLPLIKKFKREYYLVGGTAIALHIGHRRSIDFDLFKPSELNISRILQKINAENLPFVVTRRVTEQLNLIINNVKITFFQYPFPISPSCQFNDIIKLPDLLSLAAMKAYALGRRSKWKDYVDLYFILKNHYSIEEISQRASEIFGALFSEKQFRSQLCYFVDIDYTEAVEYLATPIQPEEIKEYLQEKALDIF